MIMSAGLGTRLRPFTETTCKPFLPILGIPTAQFTVDALLAAGVKKLVFNVHHLSEQTKNEILKLDHAQAEVMVSDESHLLLGSAGALKQARPYLGSGSFFYANADVVSSVDWRALASAHAAFRRQRGVDLTLAIFPSPPVPGRYTEILFDPKTHLITGLGSQAEGRPFFISMAVVESHVLDEVPNGVTQFIPCILQPAIERGKAAAFLTSGFWRDISSPFHWLQTHLELIKMMETGESSGSIQGLWRKRLNQVNRRIGDQIWVKRTAPFVSPLHWVGPCYWSPQGEQSQPPSALGPRSILYGSREDTGPGIGYGGNWVSENC